MKLITFHFGGKISFGVVVGEGIIDVNKLMNNRFKDLKSALDADSLHKIKVKLEAHLAAGYGADYALAHIDYCPVIPNPDKILCVGLNYEDHRTETGRDKTEHPVIFTRFADSQTGHNSAIISPKVSNVVDYEGELAVIIGKGGRNIPKDKAFEHVAGVSCYNDVSIRDWQRHTIQFTPGKNFPATGAFGPFMVTLDEIDDLKSCGIKTILNGKLMQSALLGDMIFDIPTIIHYISRFTSLSSGDVIVTGTPGGVGFKRSPQVLMKAGDEIIVEIENVGHLVNVVFDE